MKRTWRNFDGLTVAAIATSMLLLAVIGIETGKSIAAQLQQEREQDANGRQAVDRFDSEAGQEAVEDCGASQDAEGGQRRGGTVRDLQPCAGDEAAARRTSSTRRLFNALRQVESGGNDRAVGDGGRSVGPYQCGCAAWLDGGGKACDWPHLAYDRAATEAVMLGYWKRYGAVTDEARARCWNGGPAGMKNAATLPYWAKVQKELAK